ncbi:MAG: hypothetical protein CVU38_13280 [Chloroflexi bacterium HGW-Chloroflexi-1]|nr:MAG: hypothetical protein CVU38_13280 [Chloroflexi bacterium HGW-Chloroflexi-1]
MILSLGIGESSYVPDALIGVPQDQVDLDLIAIWQCYGRDPLRWEALLFFTNHDGWHSADTLVAASGLSRVWVAKKLVELANLGLLEEMIMVTGPLYRLADDGELCRVARRLSRKLMLAVSVPH